MDLRKLKTLIDLVSESGVAELEITEGEDRVRIVNRNGAAPVQLQQPITVAQQMPVAMPAPEPTVAPIATPDVVQSGTPLTSPMVGTFYRAPSPGAEPFVKVGDTVKKGQVVCIIEAMKLLNEVEADTDGVVKEVCVENGQPVEFGQSLFIIE
ncbi:MAG: acetyl-CoA carboxylase biotin carboxyl carrier protein [Sutterella wadsworthensis]|nr:acetyl-CoA carboxylase biotin carboxyl carrier protein [Sutterella wadsworthensis]